MALSRLRDGFRKAEYVLEIVLVRFVRAFEREVLEHCV